MPAGSGRRRKGSLAEMINGELIVDNRYRGTGKSKSERIMRCEAAAKLPRGSSGRGCGRAAEVRVGLEKAVSV